MHQHKQKGLSLVDARDIGRPASFGAADETALDKTVLVWQRQLQNYAMSAFLVHKVPMECAVSWATPIPRGLDSAYGEHTTEEDLVGDLQDKVHQLYSVLMQVTDGEANDIVCNSSSNGLEPWSMQGFFFLYDLMSTSRFQRIFLLLPSFFATIN